MVKSMETIMQQMTLKINNLETKLMEIKTEMKRNKESKTANSAEVKENYESTMELMLNCDKCEYKCKKESTLKKHKNTKHKDQNCKQCNKTFNTSMEMLLHIAKLHIAHWRT